MSMPKITKPENAMLGARMRVLRIHKNISQAELGERLGVSFSQVQKYEKGKTAIPATLLPRLAAALDAPIEWFFESQGKDNATFDDPVAGLLQAYSKIKDEALRRKAVSLLQRIASGKAKFPQGLDDDSPSSPSGA
jgi:transcriptional regulator with XRE-family HTH domain